VPEGGLGQLVLHRTGLAIACVGLAFLWVSTDPTLTQQPTLSISARVSAEPGVSTPLGIRLGSPAALPRSSFLRIRGLPPMASLSEGHAIAPGSWAVPISAIENLSVMMAPDGPARSDIVVTLVSVEGAVLAEARTTLAAAAAASPARPADANVVRSGTALANEARPTISGPGLRLTPSMTPEDRDRAVRLLQKGQEHLAEGNVAAARLMFERAADVGLAQAAMALAATFDATELAQLSVRGGIQADAKEARRWYERAQQLGAAEAEPRLRRLGSN